MAKKKTTKKTTKKTAKKATKKTTKKTTKKAAKKKPSKKKPAKKVASKTTQSSTAKKKDRVNKSEAQSQLVGKKVPTGQFPVTGDTKINLSKLTKAVIYFYPKDNTSGCTVEGQDFTAYYKKFKAKGYDIFGVSPDSLKSHEKFKDKYGFPFELISDEDKKMCEKFGVWKEKSMYGRKYMGVVRSTFLIDKGKVIKEWRKVKVKGHVEDVLESL